LTHRGAPQERERYKALERERATYDACGWDVQWWLNARPGRNVNAGTWRFACSNEETPKKL